MRERPARTSWTPARPGRPYAIPVLVLLMTILGLAFRPAVTAAQEPATRARIVIEGYVYDADTAKPLPYANVTVVGTTWGAMTKPDGSYSIGPVPAGLYELRATFVGYDPEVRAIQSAVDAKLRADFRLKPVVTSTREVTIKAQRPLVDVKRASTIRSYDQEEIESMALEPTLDSVVEQAPGVTKDNDQLHIRGGRADETLYIVDGVKSRDLLSGDSKGSTIGARSVAEVNIITGGFDAKYGQALSGIVEAKLKEGSDQFQGYVGYVTDALLDDQNLDFYEFQVSGPFTPLPGTLRLLGVDDPGKMTFFFNVGANLSDGWLPSISDLPGDRTLVSSYRDRFFGKSFRYRDFFYPRAANQWRMLFKSSWRPTSSDKFDFSVTKNLSFHQGFGENDISDINRNETNYPWNWARRLDHYYTVSDDQNTLSLIWNKGVSQNLVHALTLTRYYTSSHRDVSGMNWLQYDTTTDSDVLFLDEDTPYFRDIGDAPDYRDRFSRTWSLATDWTLTRGRQKFDAGWTHQLEEVQYLTLDATTVDTSYAHYNPLGDEFDLFHVYPASGALYVQDRLEYESLIAGVGIRYDYWFPGESVENLYENWETANQPTITKGTAQEFMDDTHEIFGHRFKGHLSPRIQISHPITNRDNLFFNYGHFSQRPPYYYVYSKLSSQSSREYPRIGNPNLNPEIAVQYEIGAGHQFRPTVAAKASVFYKDIYDYPTSTTIEFGDRQTVRSNFFIYLNRDYARSTGIEVELRKRRTRFWSGSVAYTYSVAKGKASDPNYLKLVQESGGDSRETRLGEVYMWWNRPHKLTLYYSLASEKGQRLRLLGQDLPDNWNMTLYTLLQSGRAYTPQNEAGFDTGQEYSRNGPVEFTTNLKLRKGFRLLGLNMEGTAEIFNLFDRRTPLRFDPVTGKAYEPGKGSLDSPYQDPRNLDLSDEELLEATGYQLDPEESAAEAAASIRQGIRATAYQYDNPSYRSAPRSIRIGVGVEW